MTTCDRQGPIRGGTATSKSEKAVSGEGSRTQVVEEEGTYPGSPLPLSLDHVTVNSMSGMHKRQGRSEAQRALALVHAGLPRMDAWSRIFNSLYVLNSQPSHSSKAKAWGIPYVLFVLEHSGKLNEASQGLFEHRLHEEGLSKKESFHLPPLEDL